MSTNWTTSILRNMIIAPKQTIPWQRLRNKGDMPSFFFWSRALLIIIAISDCLFFHLIWCGTYIHIVPKIEETIPWPSQSEHLGCLAHSVGLRDIRGSEGGSGSLPLSPLPAFPRKFKLKLNLHCKEIENSQTKLFLGNLHRKNFWVRACSDTSI